VLKRSVRKAKGLLICSILSEFTCYSPRRLKDEIKKLEKKAEFDIEDLKRRQNKVIMLEHSITDVIPKNILRKMS
jgi:hypothetical protein